jgi:hypothetical protein
MADPLYLSLWFPSFDTEEMFARSAAVMREFPFSPVRPGITYISVHPLAWSEPTILERRFDQGISPEEAADLVAEFAHVDYAFVFEAFWDLWAPQDDPALPWIQRPIAVRFVVHGKQFEEGLYTDRGHLEVDFGLDTPFLHDELDLTPFMAERVKFNVAKLVDYGQRLEQNCALSGRVLWSESEENLAQKLVSRLQATQ